MEELNFLGFQECKTDACAQQYSVALNRAPAVPRNEQDVI
jgi:hypothetical protein